ncbi:hypothetical protein BJ741DRAFT_113233 [Chytriomyces cf. hyalinus JEL632]|nr:hypothetical protein BJ741DRAFT_113233 [Chytriomyces cf. hyalinus JEL632]
MQIPLSDQSESVKPQRVVADYHAPVLKRHPRRHIKIKLDPVRHDSQFSQDASWLEGIPSPAGFGHSPMSRGNLDPFRTTSVAVNNSDSSTPNASTACVSFGAVADLVSNEHAAEMGTTHEQTETSNSLIGIDGLFLLHESCDDLPAKELSNSFGAPLSSAPFSYPYDEMEGPQFHDIQKRFLQKSLLKQEDIQKEEAAN